MNFNEVVAAVGAKRTRFGSFSATCSMCGQLEMITLSRHKGSNKTVFEPKCDCTADNVREALAAETGADRTDLLTASEARKFNGGAPAPGRPKPKPDDDEDWPPPQPITSELKPVPVFEPAKMLPEPLATWVHQQAYSMACPVEFIAVPLLVTIGSLIGTRCGVKPKFHDAWIELPNLWGAVVGPPGSKKSPAMSAGLAPLNRLITKAMKDHQQDVAAHQVAQLVYDAKTDLLKKKLKPAITKGHEAEAEAVAALQAHVDNPPSLPTPRRFKSNDSTMEKLGDLLKENPTGLLVMRDELVGLLSSWDREGREGERAFFLESWNGTASYTVDRIKRGSTFIPYLCLSLVGGIQPDKLIGYLDKVASSLDNDGLLQRFQLLVYPDAGSWQWRDIAQDHRRTTEVIDLIASVANASAVDDWKATPSDRIPYLSLDDDARRQFSEWTEKLHSRIAAEKEALIAQHLAKFDKLMLALALIFHLVEGGTGQLTSKSIRRAALWCDLLEAHARRCYALLFDEGFRAAKTLTAKLQEKDEHGDLQLPDDFTLRDVRRRQWRHLTDDKDIQAALEWLEDDNWIRSREARPNGRGRPTIRYRVNPKVRSPS